MNSRKRRECCLMGECLLFKALEHSDQRIINNHRLASANILQEGIQILQNITHNYLKDKYQQQQEPPTFGCNLENNILPIIGAKKELISQTSDSSYTQPKRCYSFDKSEIKQSETYANSFVSKKKIMSEADQLRQSLKKLNLEDKTQNCYGEQVNFQNMDCSNLQYLKQKTVAQLIMESNRKIEEKLSQNKQAHQRERSLSSDSSYPMTDYSSNQSSNDHSYQEELISEQSTGKPETYKTASNINSSGSLSQSLYGSNGFQAMKLMHSPKKSKSKVKRLYVRHKRVPRWAEDLNMVKQTVTKQKQDPNFDPFDIYGLCLVEKLDTNVIFNGNEIYHRGSSARWNRHPYSQFE